jgi:hypothetical protein
LNFHLETEEHCMIRTTYRGREIKILTVRGMPHQCKLVINGRTINNGWPGTHEQGIEHLQQVIDQLDQAGGPGTSAERHPWATSSHWWEPGTFDVNPAGHATAPGGFCLCTQCVIAEVGGGKARYTPLHPNACRHCHQGPNSHRNDFDLMSPHRYTAPTDAQRAGRQAYLDDYMTPDDEPEPCPAIYHRDLPGYLSRPRCGFSADHREAVIGDRSDHVDNRGFRWKASATS